MYDLTTIQAINIAAKMGLKEPTTPHAIRLVGSVALAKCCEFSFDDPAKMVPFMLDRMSVE